MVVVEEAKNVNLPLLRTIFLKERQRTFTEQNTSEFKLEDFDKQTQGEYILSALIDDIPVGFISIWMPNNFIHHLYVDNAYQGKNIGTQLLKAAIQKTAFPITLKCLVSNTKAIDFYLRKGFVEKSRGQSGNGTYILFELTKEIQ
ncbi:MULTISPECIES: GNAT family N-acetyltransferase [Flavobacterium]|uniref:Acetyltransferase n=1 Tax=Flavobacterium anhuiense TaxID=459526 RepID=A0AAC9D127_9FLAO|nr:MULTISPECIES: GNAT family N-acetyltransferase [Flavobacterium]AOC96001.1 putative acetyltransferase [Flavobacterium anhuiense]EJF99883.1 N-acetyltransferase GCN5 [Flavobacterium sp. F52]URM36641.1 GNAT family N-acetyltransferase [Flavobacterium anhuiense]